MEGCRNYSVSSLGCSNSLAYLLAGFRLIGVPSSTFYMMTYDHLLRNILPSFSPWPTLTPLFAGVVARTTISTLASPLELIRTNLQSTPASPDTPHTLRSVLNSVRGVAQAQGLLSLWRGVGPTLWRDVPFSGIYWALYERLKGEFESRGHRGPPVAFVSGAVSGTTAAIIVSPFDTAKTRRQAFVMSGATGTTNSLTVLREVVRTEGVQGLFAGLTPRIAKIAPACGIMITCFEVSNFKLAALPYVETEGMCPGNWKSIGKASRAIEFDRIGRPFDD